MIKTPENWWIYMCVCVCVCVCEGEGESCVCVLVYVQKKTCWQTAVFNTFVAALWARVYKNDVNQAEDITREKQKEKEDEEAISFSFSFSLLPRCSSTVCHWVDVATSEDATKIANANSIRISKLVYFYSK